MAFTIMVRQNDSVVILDLAGRLVLGQPIEDLRDTIRQLLDDGYRRFVLNLSRVPYMDTSGLGQIVAVHASIDLRAGRVTLLSPSTRINQLLQIAKLVRAFDVYDDEAKAIGALTKEVPLATSHP